VTEKIAANVYLLHGSEGLDTAHPDAAGGRAQGAGPGGIEQFINQRRHGVDLSVARADQRHGFASRGQFQGMFSHCHGNSIRFKQYATRFHNRGPEFRKKNPLATVSVLELDDGEPLSIRTFNFATTEDPSAGGVARKCHNLAAKDLAGSVINRHALKCVD